MNGNGFYHDWVDAADVGSALPPAEYAAPASTYESTDSGFFSSLFQTVGDFGGSVLKSVASRSGNIVEALVRNPPTVTSQSGPSFGPGAPMLRGLTSPLGYPGVGSGGPTFIPFSEPGRSTFMAGLFSNPMMMLALVGGILAFMFLVRR